MKTKRRILLAIVSLCLILSMMPLLPVAADGAQTTTPDTDIWDGSISLDWITGSDTYDGTYENVDGRTYQVYPVGDNGLATEGSKYYQMAGYSSPTTFIMDSAADLAGLAALVNAGTGHKEDQWFKNCTFIITKNIDLDNRNWTPIGKTNDYDIEAMIIGSLNKEDGTGEAITIKNLNMTLTDNGGFVGTQRGGGMKNITIDGAKISTSGGSVAPFVGYSKGDTSFSPVYENLTVKNAEIESTTTSTNDTRLGGVIGFVFADASISNCSFSGTVKTTAVGGYKIRVGGLVGDISGATANRTVIDNCTVTGKVISVSTGDALVGGIAGRIQKNIVVSNCTFDGTVESDSARTGGMIGYASLGVTVTNGIVLGNIIGSTSNGANNGVGGVIGFEKGNVTISNTYVGATISDGKYTGGFVGYGQEGMTFNLTNCHFDGIIEASHTQNGAFFGRVNAGAKATTINMENCLNTGVAKNSRGLANAFSWVGHSGQVANASSIYNIKNCYSNIDIPFAAWLDAGDTYTTTWTINEWDNGTSAYVEKAKAESGTTNASALINYKPTCLSLADMTAANLKGFDCTDTWVVRTGKTPILKAAEGKTVTTYETADMSWFAPTEKNYTITTESQLLGLEKLAKVITNGNGYTVKVSDSLTKPTTEKIAQTWIDSMLYVGDANETKVKVVGAQVNTMDAENHKLRFIAEIDGNAYDKAGFDIFLSYINGEDKTVYSSQKQVEVTCCYTSYKYTDSEGIEQTATAESGKYFVIVEITNLMTTVDKITVNYSAFVVEDGTYTYASSAPVGVCLLQS